MNLKEIEYIVTLAEEGKLARAAQRLFITPSALTQQVSNLEHEIGLPLFERSRSGWSPTRAGQIYLSSARQILQIRQETERRLQDLSDSQKGNLSIGVTSEHGTTTFTHIYPAFHKQFPEVTINIYEANVRAQQQIIRTGNLDLLIGTHKLLQKNMEFKDLGLLVIDEEQRFGVTHKERLKEMSRQVDVLTLSATPIPRTLNMALSGLRDMSTIEEPPADRQPVQTYVLEHDWGILEDAMRKELARGGQIYYLHNRVETIDLTASRIQKLLGPEVRVVVGHGKMGEQELSAVMQAMVDGEADILVCTTIIETGIDIPNVNTLIMEDADRLGLAQLHQIRGRIGRSTRRAYAYLTYRQGKILQETAAKRLAAIREYVEFGSGFKIAMRDLEIRGAGNLLGPEQSGYMMSVGYDMYLKLLNDAVLEQQGKGREIRPECSADLTVAAYIPERYVPSDRQRMDLYRRIAALRDNDAAADLIDELTDRYGDPPRPVTALLDVALLRAAAADTGVTDITQKGQTLLLSLGQRMDVPSLMAVCTLPAYRSRLLLSAGEHPKLTLHLKPGEEALDAAGHLVEALTLKRKEISGETPAEGGTL